MKAFTYIEKGKFALIEKQKPELQAPTDAIVRVTLGSICSSDLHIKHGSVPRAVPGITVGHEMVGVVEEIGSDVKGVKVGDRVTVKLNGELVVDNVIMENYWDRSQPILPIEQIELQAHGSRCFFRDIYVKELPKQEPFQLSEQEKKEGFKVLFDGTNMHEWTGNTVDYILQDGCIA